MYFLTVRFKEKVSCIDRSSIYDHQVHCSCSVALFTNQFSFQLFCYHSGVYSQIIFKFVHYIKLKIYKEIKFFQLLSSTQILVARHCCTAYQSDILMYLHFLFLCCKSDLHLCTMNCYIWVASAQWTRASRRNLNGLVLVVCYLHYTSTDVSNNGHFKCCVYKVFCFKWFCKICFQSLGVVSWDIVFLNS